MGVLPSKEAAILAQEGKMTESWYEPLGAESVQRMEKNTYGTNRKQTFLETTHRDCFGRDIYRFEEDSHSLAKQYGGKILLFEKNSQDIPSDEYDTAEEKTKLLIGDEKPLTARAFFTVPPCYIPVGEQTLLPENDDLFELASILGNKSKVLVGEVPKIFALFVNVDGKPQVLEKISKECHEHMNRQYLKDLIYEEPVPGSFVCWQPVEYSWQTLFLDVPVLGGLEEVEETRDTGLHGTACVAAFVELLTGLGPGTHNIEMELYYYFDHSRFTRMKISTFDGDDAFWAEGYYGFERFKSKHPKQGQLERCSQPLAKGSFTIEIKESARMSISEMIDLKVPPETYKEGDAEAMRRFAYDAYMKFHYFLDDELNDPDHIVLSSPIREYSYTKQEGIHDIRKTYKFIEVTLLWLNGKDPDSFGKMLDQVMIRTDDADSPPPGAANQWVMAKRRCVIDLHVQRVKNKYIYRTMNATMTSESESQDGTTHSSGEEIIPSSEDHIEANESIMPSQIDAGISETKENVDLEGAVIDPSDESHLEPQNEMTSPTDSNTE